MDKTGNRRQIYLMCALLVIVTLAVYWPVIRSDFVNFDDDLYVTQNAAIANGVTLSSVKWALTTTYQNIWMPLVWISYLVDHDISVSILDSADSDPAVFHTTNLLLHIANAVLLFLLLTQMTRRPWLSMMVALLFAVHPLRVESVAWVAERKDVLSTLFWFLTMLAYVNYVRKPNARLYTLMLLAYGAGIMSKPTLSTLPLGLLILDFWPLGRLGKEGKVTLARAIREKIPLFALAAAAAVITVWASPVASAARGTQSLRVMIPFSERVANSLVSYVQYILMMLWPRNLAVFYPHPGHSVPLWQILASAVLLLALCVLSYRARHTRPYITAGWLWYVITLIPMIGLVQVGIAGLADRFTYVPLIGLFVLLVWWISDILQSLKNSSVAMIVKCGLGVGVTAILMLSTYVQVGYWRDSCTLFSHAVRVTRSNALAHRNLGYALEQNGKIEEAISHYRQSIKIAPDDPGYLDDLGRILTNRGTPADLDEAIGLFRRSLELAPTNELTQSYLAAAMYNKSVVDQARPRQ